MSAIEQIVPRGGESEETLLRVVRLLQGIVETASQADDVNVIKSKLVECMSSILEEVEQQRAIPARDRVTGLPHRDRAEEAILSVCNAETPACICVVAVDCLPTLNLRFGQKVGDEILRHYANMLRGNLPAEDLVFRWSGPALVVLRLRPGRIEQVRREFGRLLDERYEQTVQTASRVVHLPVLPRWAIWTTETSPLLLVHKIDSFASMQDQSKNGHG